MMHMSGTLIALMILLVVLILGLLLAFRFFGGREVKDDHPR